MAAAGGSSYILQGSSVLAKLIDSDADIGKFVG